MVDAEVMGEGEASAVEGAVDAVHHEEEERPEVEVDQAASAGVIPASARGVLEEGEASGLGPIAAHREQGEASVGEYEDVQWLVCFWVLDEGEDGVNGRINYRVLETDR